MSELTIPVSRLVLVTPTVAKELLSENTVYQRKAYDKRISLYANLMRRGRWQETPSQQIAISKSGKIIDGQHRLRAVISANIPVRMWICYGVCEDNFAALDQGFTRTKSQLATMANCKNNRPYHVAAVMSLTWHPSVSIATASQCDTADVIFLLNHFENQLDAIFPHGYCGVRQIRTASFRGALLRALISQPDKKNDIVNFMKIAAEGVPLPDSDIDCSMPLMLRNVLQGFSHDKGSHRQLSDFITTGKVLRHFLTGTKIIHKGNVRVKEKDIPKNHYFPIYLDGKPSELSFEAWTKMPEQDRNSFEHKVAKEKDFAEDILQDFFDLGELSDTESH